MIPVIPTFPPTPKITLCSVLWRFCELWPQDKSIGAAATVRYQDKSSWVPEAPTTGLGGHMVCTAQPWSRQGPRLWFACSGTGIYICTYWHLARCFVCLI